MEVGRGRAEGPRNHLSVQFIVSGRIHCRSDRKLQPRACAKYPYPVAVALITAKRERADRLVERW